MAVFPIGKKMKDLQQRLSKTPVGGNVEFGSYFYKNDSEKQGIKWRVLKKQENAVLLLSEKAIDRKRYHEKYVDITWENCTLRKWLNQEFMEKAFNESEQAMIQTTTVDNSQLQGYDMETTGGNDTIDKVFLLSYKEAFNDYFTDDGERICQPTPYAENQGACVDEGNCYWWLRSPGFGQSLAACVRPSGDRGRMVVNDDDYSVRPALWINLDSDIF